MPAILISYFQVSHSKESTSATSAFSVVNRLCGGPPRFFLSSGTERPAAKELIQVVSHFLRGHLAQIQ